MHARIPRPAPLCHPERVTTADVAEPAGVSRSRLHLWVALWWCAVLLLATTAVRLVLWLRASGLPNDSDADMVASVVAAVGGAGVAAGIALRSPRNPVGWLLLALFTMLAVDGTMSFYPAWATHRHGPVPGQVAGLEQPLWVVMLALLGGALLLVPDGRLPGPRWRVVARVGAALVPLTYLAVLVVPDGGLTGPDAGIANPFAVSALDSPAGHIARALCAISIEIIVVLAVASLVVRFRRGDPDTRRQLTWVLLGAMTVPVFVLALFVAHVLSGSTGAATTFVESAGFDLVLLGIPLSIALAMARYRLYSVDAVVDSTLAWLAASGVLLLGLTSLVLLAGSLAGSRERWPPLAVAAVTAAAVMTVRQLHRALQRTINRRFHRRSFDAARTVTEYVERLRQGNASLDDLETVLSRAVGEPTLEILVPVDETWVRPDGSPNTSSRQRTDYAVTWDDAVVARLTSATATVDDRALRHAAQAATLALENTRLRAQTLVQLAEVRASRQRIVAAEYDERRRLERDLHDGAQQRLMAALLELSMAGRAARSDTELSALVERAGAEVTAAIREVRELAHGLHPAVLTEEGLAAAIESVAERAPVTVELELTDPGLGRLPDEKAAAIYFGVCECLTNAVRSGAQRVKVSALVDDQWLRCTIQDDGPGGAWIRPGGGLAGLSDRFAAGGGALALASDPAGTRVLLELPCES